MDTLETGTREAITRGRILDAAETQFRRFGPRKTSMEEIAKTAGLSRATLYLHFSGKEQIYQSLLRVVTSRFVEEVREIVVASHPAPKKFRQYVELTTSTYTNNPVFAAAISQDTDYSLLESAMPVLADYRTDILGAIEMILKQGMQEESFRQVDVKTTAYLLYELGTSILVKGISGSGEIPMSKLLDAMDDIVARGILLNQDQR